MGHWSNRPADRVLADVAIEAAARHHHDVPTRLECPADGPAERVVRIALRYLRHAITVHPEQGPMGVEVGPDCCGGDLEADVAAAGRERPPVLIVGRRHDAAAPDAG